MGYIYKITNKVNGKSYIGKTERTIQRRFQEHCHEAYEERSYDRPLYRAIRKYGKENFEVTELEQTDQAEEREIYWINFYKTYGANGYNATKGGDGTHYLDYELIIKTYNEIRSAAKVAEKLKIDQKHVLKIIEEHGDTIYSNIENAKIAVAMLDKDTEEILQIFPSIRDAERFVKCKGRGHISAVCKGKRKTAMGYKWKYL